ncbi:proline--tRNA ligase [Mycoplasma sp. P36-A1]|uniref:proline--tRNA ligase n=1 Tax=Mycoplasma sp. P36-A1 TaxID=3252900 RepID=UPI003C2B2EAC
MKQSRLFIPTQRNEINDESTAKSFLLMQKAGMIKQVAAGIFTYLPLANMVMQNIEKITREELEKISSVELTMPILQPKELWQESQRWTKYGVELMRMSDRHDREFCLAPTAEELVVSTIRDSVKSWRQLPLSVYQIQTKFRDEARPRFGLMRGREFIMKDAYSFHVDDQDLDVHYKEMEKAYDNIFKRCGLDVIKVSADNGAIGGSDSTEFMAISEIGEDTLIYCETCGYQANLEKAIAKYDIAQPNNEEVLTLKLIDTPNVSKVEDIARFLDMNLNRVAKYITYKDDITNKFYLVVSPGNYEINEVKLNNLVKGELRKLTDEELIEQGLLKGFIGPVNLKTKDRFIIVADESIENMTNHTAGGNIVDTHYININLGRDYNADFVADIKEVKETDKCVNCNDNLKFAKGIEVGHIFKLGDVYSKAMNCTYLNPEQKQVPMQMGCYGLGISRVLMAIIESHSNDENNSLIWPKEIQPFDVHLIIVDQKKEEQLNIAQELYNKLTQEGIKVLYDNRKERVGSKFADADLIGIQKRIIVGKKAVEGIVEFNDRLTEEKIEISADSVLNYLVK